MSTTSTTTNYVEEYLPPSVVTKLEAGAFQSLCTHLQERSDEVQNMDLMAVSGFCRNCLAKWLVVEARKLSDKIRKEPPEMVDIIGTGGGTLNQDDVDRIVQSLDAMGYDEAAQHLYGMTYPDWKKRHMKKVSDDQLERYNLSQPLWANHDKTLLEKRTDNPGEKMGRSASANVNITRPPSTASGGGSNPLLSNVCCQDVDDTGPHPVTAPAVEMGTGNVGTTKPNRSRQLPPYIPPPLPAVTFSLGVLTVSDRASSGEYASGDLSGPAVQRAVETVLDANGTKAVRTATEIGIVPDERDIIEAKLKEWADEKKLDLIFTVGGTGFSPRDVTPEATQAVVDRVCEGLVSFCTMECAKLQPLASLSRGTAGIRGKTLIANLPGNPKGVDEIIPILLPLALHAVTDMKAVP